MSIPVSNPLLLQPSQQLGNVLLSFLYINLVFKPLLQTIVLSLFSQSPVKFSKDMQQQLSSHLNQNDLLFPFQSGFRQNHSTQSLLLYCLDQWYKALDDKKYVGVVFLDISKAFDTVNHNLLLLKLSHLGLSPSTIAWFKSYLSNRCHQTHNENTYSILFVFLLMGFCKAPL